VIPLFIISFAYFRIAKDLTRSPAPRFDLDKHVQLKTRTARRENVEVTKTLAVIVALFVLLYAAFSHKNDCDVVWKRRPSAPSAKDSPVHVDINSDP